MSTVDWQKSPTDFMERHGYRCRCNRCIECYATKDHAVNGVWYCNITAHETALTYLRTLYPTVFNFKERG